MLSKIVSFLLYAALLLSWKAQPVQAQMGTPLYNFSNREQVKAAVLANLKQPRSTYNIIICAGRQGMIGTALQTYKGLIDKNPSGVSPQIKSAYALSHQLTLYPKSWYWKRELSPGIVRDAWGDQLKASNLRDQAYTALPNSPEVMLAHAIWLIHQGDDSRLEAVRLIERALKLTPEWADLHYWHGVTLIYYAVVAAQDKPQEFRRYLRLSLSALKRAEQLDPKFRYENLSDYSMIYENLGRYREALTAFDAYVRYRPDWINWKGSKKTRARLVAALTK